MAAVYCVQKCGLKVWQALLLRSETAWVCKTHARAIFSIMSDSGQALLHENSENVPLNHKKESTAPVKQLASNIGRSTGRNSAGRITAFHRGGGSKRLHRVIDLKRKTPSVGIIERIEYDPNRSARIALVKWIDRTEARRPINDKILEKKFLQQSKKDKSMTAKIQSRFSLSFFSPRPSDIRNLFLSAFPSKRKFDAAPAGGRFCFPRVAVIGASPTLFVPQIRDEDGEKQSFMLSEIRKWKRESFVWTHRMKRKAAISWS